MAHSRSDDQPGPPTVGAEISQFTVAESERYTLAVAGARVEATRIGAGLGPTTIRNTVDPRFIATAGKAGFPITHRSVIDDDVLIVAHIARTSPGSRWCGIDLTDDVVLLYSPGTEHAGIDQPGLEFTFVTTTLDQMQETADRLQLYLPQPERGAAMELDASSDVSPVVRAFGTLARTMSRHDSMRPNRGDDVLCAMAQALATSPRTKPFATSRANSLFVVRTCLEYAELIGRIPSTGELCLVAHVSERRLRQAFNEAFDAPPYQFFRSWALDLAHRRLRASDRDEVTVARVAADLGFSHLGRFSRYYRGSYGELPSSTLEANRV